jgi:YggT family protein
MNLSLVALLGRLVDFYSLLIFVYVILSWFPASGFTGDARRVIGQIVEPYLGIFRRLIPSVSAGGGGIDFSPIIALLALRFGWRLIAGVLAGAL